MRSANTHHCSKAEVALVKTHFRRVLFWNTKLNGTSCAKCGKVFGKDDPIARAFSYDANKLCCLKCFDTGSFVK